MSTHARDAAVEIVRTLARAPRGSGGPGGAGADGGYVAYLAGGCVRDELLGLEPSDYDVATDAPPDRVASLFRGVREVGKAFGVLLVRVRGVTVEVTTFRRETGYSDKRRPDAVEFCDAETDAKRRDFTINALFIDPLDTASRPGGRVIDFVNGQADLARRVIRAVGDPDARLREDDLRALRAVRFAARFGFTIEPATAEAITRHARDLRGVSRERIGEELRMMFERPGRAAAAALIQRLGLDAPALDDEARPAAPLPALAALPPGAGFGAGLAAWAADRAASRGDWAVSIARDGDALAARWRRALCLSNDERDELRGTLRAAAELMRDWDAAAVARRKRLAADPSLAGALAILRAHAPDRAARIERDRDALASTWGGIAPPPLITGDDLVAAGYSPGPRFAEWLDLAYDAQLEGRVRDREAALRLVADLAAGRG